MTQQTDFRLADVLGVLGQKYGGEAAIAAVRRAISQPSEPGAGMTLAELVRLIRRSSDVDTLMSILEAIVIVARKAGMRDAVTWRLIGSIPMTPGYEGAKWNAIRTALRQPKRGVYGAGAARIDERVVEYAWIFERIAAAHTAGEPVLDAGSVMNAPDIVQEWKTRDPGPLSIVTLCYEGHAFPSDHVRYEYADLRRLPYRDGWFSTVLSVSTLEHVGMDTTIYGGDTERSANPETDMAMALRELDRVTAPGGLLLISVPFGARDERGWLRVLDLAEVKRVGEGLPWTRESLRIFRAFEEGWREVQPKDARDAGYNEPISRPGRQNAAEWVAAAETVALLEFRKAS